MASVLVCASFAPASIIPSYYGTMTMDGDLSDWSGVSALSDGTGSVNGSTDWTGLRVANDVNYIYLLLTATGGAGENAILSWRNNLFFDTDLNPATGYLPSGYSAGQFGSEMLMQSGDGYDERSGGFNAGPVSDLGFASAGDGATFLEFRIARGAFFAIGGAPVFAGSGFAISVIADDNTGAQADWLPEPQDRGLYTFAEIPEPSSLAALALGALVLMRRSSRPRAG